MPCEIHGEKGTFVLEDAAPISEIKFIDSHTKESEIFSVAQEEKNMVYECINIAEIIETKNDDQYKELKDMSQIVLRVTEEARKQNNIVFGVER
jgi:predicted dehydrogenase